MRYVFWIVICGMIGCSNGPPQSTGAVTVTDSLGRTVSVPVSVKRIVSLASSNTEILFALGMKNEIVGATEFCTYPAEAKTIPRIGGFAPQSFNLEAIVALKPDLVLAAGEFQRPIVESLERIGIPVAGFQGESFSEIYRNIDAIGTLVGRTDAARTTIAEMKDALAAVATRWQGRTRPRVLYLVSNDPLMTAGGQSMISEAIVAAGGENVFADLDGDYVRINDEEILRRDPEVIIVPRYGHDGRSGAPAVLANLAAVRQNRVLTLDADPISRPSPRLVLAVQQIADLLQPRH